MQASRVAVKATRACARASSSSSANPLRTWGPVGAFLRDQPNKIGAEQQFFAHKPAHTYWAKPADAGRVRAVWGLASLAAVIAVGGTTPGIATKRGLVG
jgi:hypothetical protein